MKEQLVKLIANKEQLSTAISNITSLVITELELMYQMGERRDRQFQTSMEYTHTLFVQRMPQPVIPFDLEVPFPPIHQENLSTLVLAKITKFGGVSIFFFFCFINVILPL